MKKITFLLLHLGYGGIESATINTCNNLCNDYKVEMISFYKLDNSQLDMIDKKVKVKFLYNGGPNKEEFKSSIKHFNVIKVFKEGFKAIKILYLRKKLMIDEIKNSKSDYIVSTRLDYSLLLNKYGKSIKIVQEHRHHNNDRRYINKLRKLTNVDYIFALTESLKNDYEDFLKGSKVKIKVVPNMVDIPSEVSNFSGNLITISRLHPGKKIDDMINIFSKIDNKKNKLYIVGSGSEEGHLKEVASSLNLNDRVVFTGYQNKEGMAKYLKDSSIFLMTSISEGLPMVLLEAMGYGIPCIAYKTDSGVKDIIDDSVNGYVINDRNESLYIEKVNTLLKDKKKLKLFSDNALKKVNCFSKDSVKKIWNEILK